MVSVSVIIPTLNSHRTLDACLQSIIQQDFPPNSLEILVIDGQSTDDTLHIASKYPVKILKDTHRSPEAAKAVALAQAQGECILFFPSDNVLPHRHWLGDMVAGLTADPDLVAVYPRYYGWRQKDTALTRYFSLFGANDPIAWFLGKADRQPYYANRSLIPLIEKKVFTPQSMPTLGDNGFLIRRSVIALAQVSFNEFFHIDVCLDLVRKGHAAFGIVNDSVIHDSGDRFISFILKRYRYVTSLYFQQKSRRRYHVFNASTDTPKLMLFCLYALTVVGPLFHAVKGYRKKPDLAWFLHPLVCFSLTLVYTAAVFKNTFSKALPV